MTRWCRLLGLVMLVTAVDAAAQAPEELGCFDVTLGPWTPMEGSHTAEPIERSPLADPSADSLSSAIPSRIRLTRLPPVRSRAGRYRIVTPETTLQTPHVDQSWSLRSDTLGLVFSTGYAGTQSGLTPDGAGWSGSAAYFTDVVGVLRYERPIRLEPVDCAAPPTVPASLDPPVLRRIELTDGEALELGERVPESVPLEPRSSGAWTAWVEATGVWAGHDTVVVRLDPDRVVHHIELRYPGDFDLSAAADSLGRAYPAARDGGELSWENRTTWLWIDSTGRSRVVMLDRRY